MHRVRSERNIQVHRTLYTTIVVFVKFVLARHKVTTHWVHSVTVLPGVTVVGFHSDVVISDF